MSTQSDDQSTTLHIVIGGLCLLVRDEVRTDGKKMLHILFPRSGHGAHHHPVLMIHPDFRVPGASNPNDPIWLDGVTLDLPSAIRGQAAGEITGTTLFSHVASEECFEGQPVARVQLKDVPHGMVKAMVTITAGQQGTEKGPGVEWNLGGCKNRKMGTWAHWQIPGLPAGEIELQCGTKTLRLRPQNGRIELVFLHEIKLPEEPPRLSTLPTTYNAPDDRRARHFGAFFPLVGKSDGHPVPTHGNPRSEDHDHSPKDPALSTWGLDYTCIMATAPAEPAP
jgi:hypothetical protein